MTKEQIYDYIMKSPENTNPMILKGLLDEISSGGVRVISFDDTVVSTSPEVVIDLEMYNVCEPIDKETLENALFILEDKTSSTPDTCYVYWNKFEG